MSYKELNIGNVGTSIKFGSDDLDKVTKTLNGVTAGLPPVIIKNTSKFGFWDNILWIENQAATRRTTIRGQTNTPSTDVELTLPPITGNDTLVTPGIANIFSLKQEFDSGILYKSMSAPATPGAGLYHMYIDSTNGHLKRKDSTGAITDFDVSAAPHRTTHVSAGADAFVKTDMLDVSSRYIEGISDPASDARRIWISTSDLKYWDNAGTPVKQTLERQSNKNQPNGYAGLDGTGALTSGLGVIGDAQITAHTTTKISIADRTKLPAGIAYEDEANTFSAANLFTGIPKIQNDSPDLLKIYRPNSTVNTDSGITFSFQNSTPSEVNVAWIYAQLETNTAGAEDSLLDIWLKRAGTSKKVFELGKRGGLSLGPDSSNLGRVTRNITRSGTAVSLASSTAEQTMFSQTVLAGAMGSNGIVRLRLLGSVFQNQATATDYTLKIKFGGTTIYQDNLATALAQSSVFLPYIMDIYLFNRGATNSQIMYGFISMNDTSSVTTGKGDITDDESQVAGIISSTNPAADTTADQTLAVTITMSVSNANVQTNVDYKWLEINPSS